MLFGLSWVFVVFGAVFAGKGRALLGYGITLFGLGVFVTMGWAFNKMPFC
jgi:hypothetical protein